MELVAGRECGECAVCCVAPNLDTPEIQKLPGARCTHLAACGGCAIYETRPSACRSYFCGWRYIAKLNDDWRPDRSKILIDFQADNLPAEYPLRPGIRFMATEAAEALFRPELLFYMAKLVEAGVPVVLAVPGPIGRFPAGTILNDRLRQAVAARDLAGVEAVLRDVLKGLESHEFVPVVHRHPHSEPAAAPSP